MKRAEVLSIISRSVGLLDFVRIVFLYLQKALYYRKGTQQKNIMAIGGGWMTHRKLRFAINH
jgi:hypothetical protein